ncbi:MAG: response regulator [Desulfobacteraceae bacterium]|nr:MAG: response regulator [Desulfobacteraceae bacterium]
MFSQFTDSREKSGIDFSINRMTLSFHDRNLEARFKSSYFESNLQVGRICHVISIFFFCIVGMWDAFFIDPGRLGTWTLVILTVTLVFLLGLAASFFALKYYARFWQQLFAFYVLATGAGFTTVSVITSATYPVYNFIGIIFCLFFCYAFIRLTFLWAAFAGNTIVTLYSVSAVIFAQLDRMVILTDFFYMFGINLLGMMVCYALELMSRRDFMLNDLLKIAESKTTNMNIRLEQMVKERTKELHQANYDLKVSFQREKELVSKLENEEKILQKSLSSLEQAETIAKLGYFEKNWKTDNTYWSKGFFRLLGYTDIIEPFSDDDFFSLIHDDDQERIREELRHAIADHESLAVEFRLIQQSGDTINIYAVADHLYSDDGSPMVTKGIFQDITIRKKAEEELKLLENQLIQAQKMESVGRLAGGVAHDYNNISSIIIGYAELSMAVMKEDNPLHSNLEAILSASRRATEITRQLLAFARKQTVDPKVIDLNRTVDSMLKILRRLIGEDIDLAWMPDENLWPVKIDPSQVDQILANLCVNARDAISGVGKITIETLNMSLGKKYCEDHPGFQPGQYAMLAVSDNGKGIPKEIMDQIFEPFFTTKGVGEGTGLGLATVYGIVKQNSGFINVYSEPGQGTTFKIYLAKHAGKTVELEPKSLDVIPQGNEETILLIEDDASILELGKQMLESLNYKVLTADTPDDALAIARSDGRSIQLLITDVIMPQMNGRELTSQIHLICPELKTLYMSGYTANVIAHHGVLDEGINFIAKPFSLKDLAIKVNGVLRQEP